MTPVALGARRECLGRLWPPDLRMVSWPEWRPSMIPLVLVSYAIVALYLGASCSALFVQRAPVRVRRHLLTSRT